MSAGILCSCLAARIERFIGLRRLSGTAYDSQARLLGHFDRFLAEEGVDCSRMTREICERYQESLSRLAPRTQGNYFGVVRQLCEYLARTDPLSYVPEPLRAPLSRHSRRPRLFSHAQVVALLAAASRLAPSDSLRSYTYLTLFGLLYSTGIRIGEALALNIEDIFCCEQRLYIAEGKFRKARWIALSASTTCALQQYLDRRLQKEPYSPDSPLWLNERRRRLCYLSVRGAFVHALQECGISWSRRSGPRIHSLRHSFAVNRLLTWYRNGQDVNARLPALATYMGHVNIGSTQVYLQPTAELLAEVDRRFHNHYLNVVLKGDPS